MIDLGKFWTAQRLRSGSKSRSELIELVCNIRDQSGEQVRKFLNSDLQAITHEVVTLSQRGSVKDTTSQVRGVHTDKAVGGTGVTADAAEFKVLEQHSGGVRVEKEDIIGIGRIASVPVVRNALVTRSVHKVAVVSSDGVERFQDFTIQLSLGVLGRLVGHETVDEAPRCRLSNHTGEWSVEEVT